MSSEPALTTTEQFLSPDHWIGALDGESKDFLTAIEAYRTDPSLSALIPSLKRFTGMGDIIYFRRPGGVTEEKFSGLAQHYNTAAEVLIEFLLPAEDQERLQLQQAYSATEWQDTLSEHFNEAAAVDTQLATASSDQDSRHVATLGAAHLIRLGQMIFFRMPQEFRPQHQEFQQFFMEAMSRYLERLDGMSTTSDESNTEVDLSAIELPKEAERTLRAFERECTEKEYIYASGFLEELKGISGTLTLVQKEAALQRLFKADGAMWTRIGKAKEGGELQTIKVPELFEALGVDQQVGRDVAELLAKYACGPGGVLDLVTRDTLKNEYSLQNHFPPEGVPHFPEYASREYQAALGGALAGEVAETVMDNLWLGLTRMNGQIPAEYFGSVQQATRACGPQFVSIALERLPFYPAWKKIQNFGYADDFGTFTRDEFDLVFAAMARHQFGFGLLAENGTTGRKEADADPDPLRLLTDDYTYTKGVFSKERLGRYVSESQKVQFVSAMCDAPTLWPDGEATPPDMLMALENLKFYDEADRKKLLGLSLIEKVRTLMPTKNAVRREIARRQALVERDLLINLAMTGELPVHNQEVDVSVSSLEAKPVVEQTRNTVRSIVDGWREEARRDTLPLGDLSATRESLFFGKDKLTGIFTRGFSAWCGTKGLPAGHATEWGAHATDVFLSVESTREAREQLMTEVRDVRTKNIGDLEKLVIRGKTSNQGKEEPVEFVFTESPDKVVLDPGTALELLAELRSIYEKTDGAPAGSLLARIHWPIGDFLESKLAGKLQQALEGLKDEEGDNVDQTKEVLGLLGNNAMEPVREAVRNLAALQLFAGGSQEFGAGRIELTDGALKFEGIYPPLLVGQGVSGVSPYSVPEGAALTVVAGPNGAGKTMLISAMAAAEGMALTGTPPLAEMVGISKDASGVPLLVIGANTTTQTSRFDHSVGEAMRIDRGLPMASSVTMDEAFAGTGDSYRGHLQVALALKALAQGKPVRLTTHQTETFYQDMAVLGAVDGLAELGIAGNTQWLSVDGIHRVVPGRISPFGIEMAAGAGFPTVIAENAKRLRDASSSGMPVRLEEITPKLSGENRLPEWASQETLLRLGINGMWDEWGYGLHTKLAEGEGDVLKFLFGQDVKSIVVSHVSTWVMELWFRQSMTRFMQQQESQGVWQQRVDALQQYAKDQTKFRNDVHDYARYGELLNHFMVTDFSGAYRDRKLDAEEVFYSIAGDKTLWMQRDEDTLTFGNLPLTLRRVRQGREMNLATEAAALSEELKAVGRISGVDGVGLTMGRVADAMDSVRAEQKKDTASVFLKALSSQATSAVGGFYTNIVDKPGYDHLLAALAAAGYDTSKPSYYLNGHDLHYFLKDSWSKRNYAASIQILRCFSENRLTEEKNAGWHMLFDGSLEKELREFPISKTKKIDPIEVVAELGRGECGRVAELFDWMEQKDFPEETKKRYREQYPLTMQLFRLYQLAMDANFATRWEDALWEQYPEDRENAIGAYERATVNLVLAEGLRNPEKTHLVFTEIGDGGKVELEEAYNPGSLEAGVKEVPQTAHWTSGQAMVISGPNTGGKTSLAKKVMVAAALHKAMGIGTGKRIRLPSPDTIGGLYASINAAETRVGEGNLASEARDVGKFLVDYLSAGCPAGVWFFGDELFTGTGQADQAGLLGATVQAVTQSGGRCIVTTNEEGVLKSLDQAGVSHQDVRFSYRDPETQFVPMPGVGGPESFRVARDLGLDPRVVDLAETLEAAQRELEHIRQKTTGSA